MDRQQFLSIASAAILTSLFPYGVHAQKTADYHLPVQRTGYASLAVTEQNLDEARGILKQNWKAKTECLLGPPTRNGAGEILVEETKELKEKDALEILQAGFLLQMNPQSADIVRFLVRPPSRLKVTDKNKNQIKTLMGAYLDGKKWQAFLAPRVLIDTNEALETVQPGYQLLINERGGVAKTELSGIESIRNSIFDPNNLNDKSVWQSVSSEEVHLKPKIDLGSKGSFQKMVMKACAGVTKDDIDRIWAIVQKSKKQKISFDLVLVPPK
jgi:hypothetical protein